MRLAIPFWLLTAIASAQGTWRIAAGSGDSFGTSQLAFDTARGELILRTSAAETWVHDGDRWERRNVVGQGSLAVGEAPMGYDSIQRRVLQHHLGNGQTSVWDGTQWTLIGTNTSLLGERGCMAFDPNRQRMLLAFYRPSNGWQTWEWDGASWTNPTPQYWVSPEAMAFDQRRGRVLAVSGSSLYERIGTSWQFVPSTLPTRNGPQWTMAYDTRRQRLVLMQGNAPQVEVFEWDGQQVSTPTPAAAPPGRWYVRSAWDPLRERVVARGGEGYPNWLTDTWEWDGASWIERDQAPAAGRPMTMAYDATRDRTVLYGVAWTTLIASTWEWDGHRWQHLAGAASPPITAGGRLLHDAARSRLQFCGNDAGVVASWTFDGTAFTPLPTTNAPPARDSFAIVYDSARQEAVMFGGTIGLPVAETWRFDGTTWSRALPTTSPTARADHAMAYDPVRDRTILFGGVAGDTWEWNGTTWTRRLPATIPAARIGHTMTFDTSRGMVVMTGGGYYAGPPIQLWARPAELFEWNGTDWRRRGTTALPAQLHGQIVHDGRGLLLHTGQRQRGTTSLADLVLASTTYRLAAAPVAGVAVHGVGCDGALGVPHLDAWHVPYLGNAAFALRTTSMLPATPVVFAYGDTTASLPLTGPCTQLLQPLFAADFALAGTGGEARVALGVPHATAMLGYALVTQAAVFDGVGAHGGISVTHALRLTLGN